MAKFSKGHTFASDEQMTHTKLNNLVDAATFASDAVDDSTTALSSGAIIVKTGGVNTAQLADNAVETAKITDLHVTTEKIAADAINADKIADNAIDSEHYTDGSIDKEHLNADVITGQTELQATPHLTQDEVLISDNGTLKRLKLMSYLPLPRAYGLIKADGSIGTADAVSLYNVTCSAATGTQYTFTLGSTMSSSDYTVIAQQHHTEDWSDSSDTVTVELVNATSFYIHVPSTTAGRHVSFAVFGTLA